MMQGRKKLRWYLVTTILSLVFIFFSTSLFPTREALLTLGLAGPIGAFFAGMLFVSSFTVIVGTFFIVALAPSMPLWELVLLAGLGAALMDVLLFYLVRHTVLEEMKPLLHKWRRSHFMHILHSKYISWTVPLIGALIILLPLSDEIGISMMGISNLNTRKFAIISFVLNCVGVFLIASAALAIT